MADVAGIRTALANQITAKTGLRTLPEAKDAISPPVAIILEGAPALRPGATLDGCFTLNLRVLIALSDAAPTEKVQRALDAYLSIGSGEPTSIVGAVQSDPTLSGLVHYAVPMAVGTPSRIEYAGVIFFGSRIDIEIGAI